MGTLCDEDFRRIPPGRRVSVDKQTRFIAIRILRFERSSVYWSDVDNNTYLNRKLSRLGSHLDTVGRTEIADRRWWRIIRLWLVDGQHYDSMSVMCAFWRHFLAVVYGYHHMNYNRPHTVLTYLQTFSTYIKMHYFDWYTTEIVSCVSLIYFCLQKN